MLEKAAETAIQQVVTTEDEAAVFVAILSERWIGKEYGANRDEGEVAPEEADDPDVASEADPVCEHEDTGSADEDTEGD